MLLAATAAALFGIGTYLVLQRKLSRIIIGLGLLSHGANVLLIDRRPAGRRPLIGSGDAPSSADPLPQALALTGHRHHLRRDARSCWRSPTGAGCSPSDDEVRARRRRHARRPAAPVGLDVATSDAGRGGGRRALRDARAEVARETARRPAGGRCR